MGKPGKWLKSVLLGKKQSKSSGSKDKERAVNGKVVLVIDKIEESDVVSDLPSFENAATTRTSNISSDLLKTQDVEQLEEVSDNEIQFQEGQPTDSQNTVHVLDDSLSDAEKIQQEIAATTVQAVFRGYLARRAFWALKGIIRLQAVIRGHMVRREAVATLCCVMGIVRLQALARGRVIRQSEIGLEVRRNCRLQQPLENSLANPVDEHAYLGIKKLTANAFAQKLLASSPKVMPLRLYNDSIWLENWSASCFWKPIPQPKKVSVKKTQKKFVNGSQEGEVTRSKKSFRKLPASDLENPSTQTSFELEKPKRNFRKVSNQSVESHAVEHPQVDLEKVKRGLRKVHNPVVENSIQPQMAPQIEIEKPKLALEESLDTIGVKEIDEMPKEVAVQSPEPLETNEALEVNQTDKNNVAIDEEHEVQEEITPKQNKEENSAGKENHKSVKKGLDTPETECQESNMHQSSPSIPSYMQATKSAKAKLRLQGSASPRSGQEGTDKTVRRYSLPSSGNATRVNSHGSKATRASNSGGKTGNKTEKSLLSSREVNGKAMGVEWKR